MDYVADIPPLAYALIVVPVGAVLIWLFAGARSAKREVQEDDPDFPS